MKDTNSKTLTGFAYFISALGALGSALQNYWAVDLFIRSLVTGATVISKPMSAAIHGVAIGFGGVCSGMINFIINVALLKSFLERFTKNEEGMAKLTGWQKFRKWAGSLVFVITGILFGLTALTFGMATPALAIAAGVFVSTIMIIQEVETWLQSFDDPDFNKKKTIKEIFSNWRETLTIGKMFGHVIAAGNVIALSLLFTLGLTEVLILMGVAALPAFIIGVSVAFTFGAFTEFYFYNFFLSTFCEKMSENWQAMKASNFAPLAITMVSINGLVNAALTYSGVMLLSGLFVTVGIGIPPLALMITIASVSAVFAGAASSILGMDFWVSFCKKRAKSVEPVPVEEKENFASGLQSNKQVTEPVHHNFSLLSTVTPDSQEERTEASNTPVASAAA